MLFSLKVFIIERETSLKFFILYIYPKSITVLGISWLNLNHSEFIYMFNHLTWDLSVCGVGGEGGARICKKRLLTLSTRYINIFIFILLNVKLNQSLSKVYG